MRFLRKGSNKYIKLDDHIHIYFSTTLMPPNIISNQYIVRKCLESRTLIIHLEL